MGPRIQILAELLSRRRCHLPCRLRPYKLRHLLESLFQLRHPIIFDRRLDRSRRHPLQFHLHRLLPFQIRHLLRLRHRHCLPLPSQIITFMARRGRFCFGV